MAEQKYTAVHQRLTAVQDELDRVTAEHVRQTQQWTARHEHDLNNITSLETDLSQLRQQLDDNRFTPLCSSSSSSSSSSSGSSSSSRLVVIVVVLFVVLLVWIHFLPIK